MSSIDLQELVDTDLPVYGKTYLNVVRNLVRNRRTFRSKASDDNKGILTGLVPQCATVGDKLCIQYGCSVLAILHNLSSISDEYHWQHTGLEHAP
jgi:hypothetical protein